MHAQKITGSLRGNAVFDAPRRPVLAESRRAAREAFPQSVGTSHPISLLRYRRSGQIAQHKNAPARAIRALACASGWYDLQATPKGVSRIAVKLNHAARGCGWRSRKSWRPWKTHQGFFGFFGTADNPFPSALIERVSIGPRLGEF